MERHGVYIEERPTSVSDPTAAAVGIPFFIGAAPVHSAANPATAGQPVLAHSWEEAVALLGYSEGINGDGTFKYSLCECMDSHFRLYRRAPAIFCNLLDPKTMTAAVAPEDVAVKDNKALIPLDAVNDESLVVKAAGGSGPALVRGTDYDAFHAGGGLVIELLESGAANGAAEVNVGYNAATPSLVTPTVVAAGLQNIDKCAAERVIPDLIVAPGYSSDPQVAAVMAVKAAAISGNFKAKALVDIPTSGANGAETRTDAIAKKNQLGMTDENQIACWPKLGSKGKLYHMSTHLAGLIATVDSGNSGVPYESPSNKAFACDSILLSPGKEVSLLHAEANELDAQGAVTALRFLGENKCWGNYTACYPGNADVKDSFISMNRMFDFVGNTFIRMLWSRVDGPLSLRAVEGVKDSCNIWLNGLYGAGYVMGARVEVRPSENPLENLLRGIVRIRIFIAPPPPLKEMVLELECDMSYLVSALAA